jgi:hypothetical protein
MGVVQDVCDRPKGDDMWRRVLPPVLTWVLPAVVAALSLVPLACVTAAGLCPEDAATCDARSTTTCYSAVGIPTNGAVAAVGVPIVMLGVAAATRARETRT